MRDFPKKSMAVKWTDSRSTTSNHPMNQAEFERFPLAYIWSIGWGHIGEDGHIRLAEDYYPDTPDQEEGYRGVQAIPKECVLEVVYLAEVLSDKQ